MKTKEFIIALVAMFAFIGIIGYAGSYEWAEEVCYSMPDKAYFSILDSLGGEASMKDIAHEYINRKDYYDSMEY